MSSNQTDGGNGSDAEPEANPPGDDFSARVKSSAQQIWLAGLGAFGKAQEEGSKFFDALVREGTALHRRAQPVAGEKFDAAAARMAGVASDVTARAGEQWSRFESLFEGGTAKTLERLGVPTKQEHEALAARVEALEDQVAQLLLNAQPAPPTSHAKAKPAEPRTAAKSAATTGTKPAAKSAVQRAVKRARKAAAA